MEEALGNITKLIPNPALIRECAGVSIEIYEPTVDFDESKVNQELKFITNFLNLPIMFLSGLQENTDSRERLTNIEKEDKKLYDDLQKSSFRGNKLSGFKEELWELKDEGFDAEKIDSLCRSIDSVSHSMGRDKLSSMFELRDRLVVFLKEFM